MNFTCQEFKVRAVELLSDKFIEEQKEAEVEGSASEDEIQVLRKNIKEKLKLQQIEEDRRKERILLMQQQEDQRAEQERRQNNEMRALDELQASLEQQLHVQKEKERQEALDREKLRFLRKIEEDKLLMDLKAKLEQERQAKAQAEERMRLEMGQQEALLRDRLQAEKQRQEEEAKTSAGKAFTCLSDIDDFMTDLDIIVTTRSLSSGTNDLQSAIDQEKEFRREREERERKLDEQVQRLEADRQREEMERRKEQDRLRKQARRDHQELHGKTGSRPMSPRDERARSPERVLEVEPVRKMSTSKSPDRDLASILGVSKYVLFLLFTHPSFYLSFELSLVPFSSAWLTVGTLFICACMALAHPCLKAWRGCLPRPT